MPFPYMLHLRWQQQFSFDPYGEQSSRLLDPFYTKSWDLDRATLYRVSSILRLSLFQISYGIMVASSERSIRLFYKSPVRL